MKKEDALTADKARAAIEADKQERVAATMAGMDELLAKYNTKLVPSVVMSPEAAIQYLITVVAKE